MQKIILPVFLLLLLSACKEKTDHSFTISGKIKNVPAKKIYAEHKVIATGQTTLKDSSMISDDGSFSMNVKSAEEGVFNLRLENEAAPFTTVINDSKKITIDVDFKNPDDFYTVSGSAASKGIENYFDKISEYQREKFDYLVKADSIKRSGGDSLLAEEYAKKSKEIAENVKEYSQDIVLNAQNPSLSLFLLATYQGMSQYPTYRLYPFTSEEIVGVLNQLLNKFPGREDIAGLRNTYEEEAKKTLWVGKDAPEISLPNTDGKTVSLSSYRGKYVLVDFWASWCGPCRNENPNVVEAYNRFKNKNFTILGVSLDKSKDAWKKAIAEDNLNWAHISDLKYWDSEVVPKYKIGGIPFNVLVNPEGKVIAENLRGYMLEQKLAQVLN